MNNEEKIITRVTGFIEPIFIGTAPDGKTLNGIGPQEWQMIKEGYACGECLATFNTLTLVCPVCKNPTGILDFVPPPQLWLDHLHERENPGPQPDRPASFDEAVDAAIKDRGGDDRLSWRH